MYLKDCDYNIFLIIAISSFCYMNIINGDFVFDDTEAVVKNPDLDLNNSVYNIFYNDFWGTNITSNYSHKSYRPFTVLFYRLNILIVGTKSPYWFHIVSIILYVTVCVTYYVLLNSLLTNSGENLNVAFISSLLFSVHPIHTEVVSSIVGHADLLCSLTFFLAVLCYKRAVFTGSFFSYCLSLVLAAVSMNFKETGVTVLGFCLWYDILVFTKAKTGKNAQLKSLLARNLGLISAALTLLYFRCWIMNFTAPTFQSVDNPASFAPNFWTRVFSYNYLYILNAVLLVWPQWLCFDWSMGCVPLLGELNDFRTVFVLGFWLFVIVFITRYLIAVFSRRKKKSRVVLLAAGLVGVTFLPAANLGFRVGFVVAERALFLPSAGFCLLIGCGFKRILHHWKKGEKVTLALFMALVMVFGARAWVRSLDWTQERLLFSSALEVCPKNAKVHYNVAKIAADNGDVFVAESEYRKALELYPNYDQAMNNLANLLRDKGELNEAKKLLSKAVTLRPDFAVAWMNFGIVLATLDLDEDAEKAYFTALKHRKNYSDCFYNLGNLYLKQRKNEEALLAWEESVRINPTHSAAWSNSLVLLDSLGLHNEVLRVGSSALSTCPNVASIHFTLANTFGKLEQWIEAEKHFKMALQFSPNNALYHSNFGVLYHRWGKREKAVEHYQKALNFDPNLRSALTNLRKLQQRK